MPKVVYVAARYSRFPEMQAYAKDLTVLGYTVSSRWILGDHDIRAHGQSEADHFMPLWAQEDWDDLCASEIVISFTEPPGDVPGRSRGGRHIEHGAALAFGKRCLVVGFRENVFHWLPVIEFYATWLEALRVLRKGH